MIKYIENNDLSELKDSKGITLVDFYASWCGPCKMLEPVLEEIANDRSAVEIYKVDIDKNEALAKEYGVMAVPTILLFKDGDLKDRTLGYLPKEEIVNKINKID